MSEKKVPEVRFRGFSGEWENKHLETEVGFYSGLTYSPLNIVESDGTLVLRSSNVKNGEVVTADNVYVNSSVVNCQNVKTGDIIVVVRNGSRGLIGKHGQIKSQMDNTVIGAFMTGVQAKQPDFTNALLDTVQFNREIEKNLGATINQITTGSFKKMSFYFTDGTDEQTKIGEFFKNLDDLIAQNQKKYDKLVNMKKACLDKMFPKDGADTPEVRFQGFSGEWEQRALGEIANLLTGYPFKSKLFAKNGIKLIRGINVKRNFLDLSEEVCEYWDLHTGLEEYLLKAKDILIQMDGALIGMSYARIEGNQLPALLVQRVTRVRSNDNVDNDFIFQAIQKSFLQYIIGLKTETAVPHLSLNDIRDFRIKIPMYDEQKKISRCLQTLDNLITLRKTELEKLKNIKKACLDKMFI